MTRTNPRHARKRAEKISKRKAEAELRTPPLVVQERADTLPPPPPNLHTRPDLPTALHLWLDDERPCPEGWTACRWPQDVIGHLEQAAREAAMVARSQVEDAKTQEEPKP